MRIEGSWQRSIRVDAEDGWSVRILDQTRLPWAVEWLRLVDEDQVAHAIRSMQTRGAPLIGATAAYGVALAMRRDPAALEPVCAMLAETRPTAINLRWAIERMLAALRNTPPEARAAAAYAAAAAIAEDDAATCAAIGRHGLPLLQEIAARKPRVNVLTHCNAGWLATVDWGTALAPIYMAHDALMQHGEVDIVIVGTDRVTRTGDVANKIGTYLKALAARDNGVPFWVALPHSTLDMRVADGVAEIPIEERSAAEVTDLTGRTADGRIETIRVAAPGSPAANPAFDVTPARLVTGLITERGRIAANADAIAAAYPEKVA